MSGVEISYFCNESSQVSYAYNKSKYHFNYPHIVILNHNITYIDARTCAHISKIMYMI